MVLVKKRKVVEGRGGLWAFQGVSVGLASVPGFISFCLAVNIRDDSEGLRDRLLCYVCALCRRKNCL